MVRSERGICGGGDGVRAPMEDSGDDAREVSSDDKSESGASESILRAAEGSCYCMREVRSGLRGKRG
jgi:hypothetical protein